MNEIRLQSDENYCLLIILITFRFSVIQQALCYKRKCKWNEEWSHITFRLFSVLPLDIPYKYAQFTMYHRE